MRKEIIAVALLLGATAPTAQAATPTAPAAAATAPTPDALAAARELMLLTDLPGQMRTLAPRMAEASGREVRKSLGEAHVPEQLQAQIAFETQTFIGSVSGIFTPELIDRMATVYARHFTAVELRQIATLMRDPVMVKFRAAGADISTELLPVMAEAMRPEQEAYKTRVRGVLTDWIAKHPEDAKALPPPASL